MTLPNANTLDPVTVRVMCAEEMGWDCLTKEGWPDLGHMPGRTRQDSYPMLLPEYAKSADAALALVEKMREEGWMWDTGHAIGGGYRARFFNSNAVQIEAFANHPAMATALCFLKARGRAL